MSRWLLSAAIGLISLAMSPPAASATTLRPMVVGGQPAATGTLPWLARIEISTPADGDYLCSGTVIAPAVVLTAAHCAVNEATMQPWSPSDYLVDTDSVHAAVGGQFSSVTRVVIDPGFDETPAANGNVVPRDDLAVLKLSKPTTATAITLGGRRDGSLYAGGTSAEIAGWGLTDGDSPQPPWTLQVGQTVVQSQAYCQDQASAVFGVPYDSSSEICAIDAPTDSEGTCSGDSGGPLVAVRSDGTPIEIGIIDWAQAQCNTRYPDFFTDVAAFASWISTEATELSPPATTSPAPSRAPATTDPPPAAPSVSAPYRGPEWGTYRGRGRRIDHISFKVTKNGRYVKAVAFSFSVACTRSPGRLGYRIKFGRSFRLRTHSGLGFSATTRDRDGWRYRLSWLLTQKGAASGTIDITGHSAKYGSCRSGLLRWTAS